MFFPIVLPNANQGQSILRRQKNSRQICSTGFSIDASFVKYLPTGDVLVFLDAHMELGEGWLEPYLQRIKEDYKNVVIPTLDMIHYQHFGVSGASKVLYINTMDWSLNHVFREIFFTSIQSR